jgi:hypothetical protein
MINHFARFFVKKGSNSKIVFREKKDAIIVILKKYKILAIIVFIAILKIIQGL